MATLPVVKRKKNPRGHIVSTDHKMGFFNSKRHSNRLQIWLKQLSRNNNLRLFLCEMVSTMFVIFFSDACFAQIFFGRALDLGLGLEYNRSPQSLDMLYLSYGTWLNYALGNGIAHAVFIASVSSVKEVHLNPAITVAAVMSDLKDTSTWAQVPVFFSGQCLGGLLGNSLLYSLYHVQLGDVRRDNKDGGESRRIFSSYPMPPNHDTPTTVLCWDQTFATGVAVMTYLVCHDPDPDGFMSSKFAPSFAPLLVGMGNTLITLTNGIVAAAHVNPARDFTGRFFSFFLYGKEVWELPARVVTAEETEEEKVTLTYFFWVPLLMPYVGAIFGTFVYAIAIAFHRSAVREKRKRNLMKKLKLAETKIKLINSDLNNIRVTQLLREGGPDNHFPTYYYALPR